MSTSAQIAANQQNATRSTGPRTGAGKAASSQNGVSHGLSSGFRVLVHESQSDFDLLTFALFEEFNPQDEHQLFLVNEMAQARWRMSRIDRLEAKAFEAMLNGPDATADGRIVAYLSKNNRDPLTLLLRYRAAAERAYFKAARELQQLRKADEKLQKTAMDTFVNQYVYGEPKSAPRQNGFASQTAPSHGAAPRAGQAPGMQLVPDPSSSGSPNTR